MDAPSLRRPRYYWSKWQRQRRRRRWRRHRRGRRLRLPSRRHIVDRLLDSIAKEELALARLIRAIARQISSVSRNIVGPITADELVRIQRGTETLLSTTNKKEQALQRKLKLVLSMANTEHRDDYNFTYLGDDDN